MYNIFFFLNTYDITYNNNISNNLHYIDRNFKTKNK